MRALARRGVPLVVSAPSGAGKTTLCRRLVADLEDVGFSISHTTRPPRGRERDGVDYHFVDDATFDGLVEREAFLEWAPVHGCRYGTSRRAAEARLAQGIDVLFDIDVQGGHQIASRLEDAVLVFIMPPSMAVLEQRLRGRKTDSEEQISRRMVASRSEMSAAADYHYWVINDDLGQAYVELKSVLVAHRLRGLDRDRLRAILLED